jgi:hypothetical protein
MRSPLPATAEHGSLDARRDVAMRREIDLDNAARAAGVDMEVPAREHGAGQPLGCGSGADKWRSQRRKPRGHRECHGTFLVSSPTRCTHFFFFVVVVVIFFVFPCFLFLSNF